MYVYLRWSNSYKRTAHVSLNLRKCMPVVGTYSEGRIDPALWFKVLVLEAVFVDIDRRKVFWSCQRPDDPEEPYITGANGFLDFFDQQEEITSISDNGDYDYDPKMSELFGTARDIYTRLSEDVFDKEGNVATYEDLLKILHVFILPEVKFHSKDRQAIHGVFEAMENECQMVEMMINKKVNQKRNHEESLARQRRSLVKTEQMLGHLNDLFIDDEFYCLLSKHLDKDVKKLEDNMVSLSDKIVRLKQYKSDKIKPKLSQARETRNKYVKEKERLIVVKEELKIREKNYRPSPRKSRLSVLTRTKSWPKKKSHPSTASHTQYITEAKQLENTNEDIKTLINSKIKLSGVREAVHLTLTEIDGDGVSYGYNRKRGTLGAEADMFDPRKKPEEWMTLHEQVYEHLKLNHTELKTKHDRFCSKIRGKCYNLLSSSGITRGSDGSTSVASSDSRSAPNVSMRYSVRWLYGSVSKEECENICTEVSEHILDLTHILADELQGADTCLAPTYYTHVYICYEKHVSEDIMATLSDVYRESFRSKCDNLYEWISSYAATELDFIETLTKKLLPDTNEHDLQTSGRYYPTGSLPYNRSRCRSKTWKEGQDLKALSRLSKSLEHLPLDSLVDQLHAQTGSLAATFDKAWRVISTESGTMETLHTLSQDDVIRTSFLEFFNLVQEESTKRSIFDKLRLLSRAVQFVEERASELLKRHGHIAEHSTDDMLDLLIMVICKLDSKCLLSLYADVNLIFHLTPRFLQGSISQFCLITLTGAYQHLFECQEKLHASSEELSE